MQVARRNPGHTEDSLSVATAIPCRPSSKQRKPLAVLMQAVQNLTRVKTIRRVTCSSRRCFKTPANAGRAKP